MGPGDSIEVYEHIWIDPSVAILAQEYRELACWHSCHPSLPEWLWHAGSVDCSSELFYSCFVWWFVLFCGFSGTFYTW